MTEPTERPTGAPRGALGLTVWCMVAAFGAYFCMYGFRKPFTAATFEGQRLWGLDCKTVLVTSQVFGYMVSKFIGIKVVSEMPPNRRAVGILALIGLAELSLLFFAVVPRPVMAVPLFFNGLALGMVFGLVLGFLEGRSVTEAMVAGLCASFIVADGASKSTGAYLLELGSSATWMPFLSGLIFLPPLGLFVWMLSRIPPPSADDVAHRSARDPMTGAERWRFFRRYAVGLVGVVLAFLLVTVLRSLRADFAPELWKGLNYPSPPSLFTKSETLVALGVVSLNGLAILIRDNRRAFHAGMGISILGLLLVGLLGPARDAGWVGGFWYMALAGVGLYLPYVAVHTTIFERLIAMTRDRGNLGYLMYLADAFGYLGYVGVMLGHELIARQDASFLDFFDSLLMVVAGLGAASMAGGWYFLIRRSYRVASEPTAEPVAVEVA